MSKVTNRLYSLVELAESRDPAYIHELDALFEHHKTAAEELLSGADLAAFEKVLTSDIDDLKAMLRAISIGEQCASVFGAVRLGKELLMVWRLLWRGVTGFIEEEAIRASDS